MQRTNSGLLQDSGWDEPVGAGQGGGQLHGNIQREGLRPTRPQQGPHYKIYM